LRLRCDQIVVVERVIEVGRELEVDPLDDLEFPGERNIPILVRRTVDGGNSVADTGVAEVAEG